MFQSIAKILNCQIVKKISKNIANYGLGNCLMLIVQISLKLTNGHCCARCFQTYSALTCS
jgi:hypothetical protein